MIHIIAVLIVLTALFCYYRLYSTTYYISTVDGLKYQIISGFDGHEDAARLLSEINIFIISILRYLRNKYCNDATYDPTDVRTKVAKNILNRYNPDVLSENNPRSLKYTSYVLNKGDEIRFCLREKTSGQNRLHTLPLMKFVVLHEMSHMGDDGYGHTEGFWTIFKFLLQEANNAGLYTPINFANNPANYCGIDIQYSPFYDETLPNLGPNI